MFSLLFLRVSYHKEMKNLILTLILLVFVSCSMKETLVSNMDTLIYHKTQSKLDLDSKQKTAIKEDIKKFLNAQKSKTNEAHKLVNDIDLSKIEEIGPTYRGLIELYREVAIAYSAVVSKYIAQFDESQQKAFFKELDKDNKELEENIKEGDLNDYYKRFKFFFGSINESQKKVITAQSDFFRELSRTRLEGKKKLRAEIFSHFAQQVPTHEKQKRIYESFKTYNTNSFTQQEKMIEIIQKLVVEADSKQITFFNEKKGEALEIISLFAKSKY